MAAVKREDDKEEGTEDRNANKNNCEVVNHRMMTVCLVADQMRVTAILGCMIPTADDDGMSDL